MQTTIPRELEIKEATPEIVEREGQKEIAPDVIELTISEVDRQSAGRYYTKGGCQNCIIGTALRNRGYNVRWVGVDRVGVECVDYKFDAMMHAEAVYTSPFAEVAPFYTEQVVGKVIRMRKVI